MVLQFSGNLPHELLGKDHVVFSPLTEAKWVLVVDLGVKTDQQEKLNVFKARVAAEGCSQLAGVDSDEPMAPTVGFQGIRSLVAMGSL